MTNSNDKLALFFIYVLIFLSLIYWYGPSVVFYFDQTQGEGKITSIIGNRIYLEYFHNNKNKRIKIFYKDKETEDWGFQPNMKVKILYSNRYPSCVAFLNYGDRPDLSNLIILIFSAIPIVFYKNILDELGW